MVAFSSIFPKKGKGPEWNTQGTGPLVTREGGDKVPVRMVSSRAAGPESTMPFSQRTHKEQGTYLERETPRTPKETTVADREKELAKEQARTKRQLAKRAREEAALAEASKKQWEDVLPEESLPAQALSPVEEAFEEEESSPSARLLTRKRRSKMRNDDQLPSPTPEVPDQAEITHRPGKEVLDSEAVAPSSETSAPQNQADVSPPEEVLPSIPDFPEDSYLGMDEDNYVEANEALMREQLLNRLHDPELTAEVEAAWSKGGVEAFVAESLKVCIPPPPLSFFLTYPFSWN